MPARRHIALVTRELHPFSPGGIAPIVAALARTLARDADVTLLTTSNHEPAVRAHGGAEALYGPGVEIAFARAPEPAERDAYICDAQALSARLFEGIAERWAGGGAPDLIEFCDYLAEGFVTLLAKRAHEPLLQRTTVAVRTHTTAEIASILNGSLPSDVPTEAVFEAERYCLRHADRLLVPGGDVLATYRRFYGEDALAPALLAREPFLVEGAAAAAREAGADGPLRMLFLGRLERRKGVLELVRALIDSDREDWSLTLLGADTPTGPLGVTVGELIAEAVGGDPRFTVERPVPRAEVGAAIAAHDLVVVPSLWECWPNVVREALLHGRPVLATPVGGMVEMVGHEDAGWLADGTSPGALRAALEPLIDEPGRVRALTAAGAPRRALERIVDPDATRAAYRTLLQSPAEPPVARHGRPLVSVVIPYFRSSAHIAEAVESVRAQTWPELEIAIVDDGSFGEEDGVIARLADTHGVELLGRPNGGVSAARNLGIAQARGSFVLPMDADNVLEPEFLERCMHTLMRDESAAFATTWSRYVDESGEPLGEHAVGYSPYGNWSRLVDRNNVAGDATAVLRRAIFDAGFAYHTELASYEDWFLYRQLHHAGHVGSVIPRRLFRYRVRVGSLLRAHGLELLDEIYDQMNARMAENRMTWATAIA